MTIACTLIRAAALLALCAAAAGPASAQGQVTVLCSTDQGWC